MPKVPTFLWVTAPKCWLSNFTRLVMYELLICMRGKELLYIFHGHSKLILLAQHLSLPIWLFIYYRERGHVEQLSPHCLNQRTWVSGTVELGEPGVQMYPRFFGRNGQNSPWILPFFSWPISAVHTLISATCVIPEYHWVPWHPWSC